MTSLACWVVPGRRKSWANSLPMNGNNAGASLPHQMCVLP
jgi:hypothetical protein